MKFDYTDEQLQAINTQGNLVITACPGSGKTTVLVKKIEDEMADLQSYQGVIGITFTNKASSELKTKIKKLGLFINSSFIGTIDQFCLSEIIYPFAKNIFGKGPSKIECAKFSELPNDLLKELEDEFGEVDDVVIQKSFPNITKFLYLKGFVVLSMTSQLASFIISNSSACQNYIRSKYKTIYIDEYQDSSGSQHCLFKDVIRLGLKGVVVGDINQSIYKWRDGDPKHLIELASRTDFTHLSVQQNHRCHPSITNYANRLLDANAELQVSDKKRVYHCSFQGTQVNALDRIADVIAKIMDLYTELKYSDMAILVRNNATLDLCSSHFSLPSIIYKDNPLKSSNQESQKIFDDLLKFKFFEDYTATDIIDKYIKKISKNEKSKLIEVIKQIRVLSIKELESYIPKAASLISGLEVTTKDVDLLLTVMNDKDIINSYSNPDSINIMTIHKSKGLEFQTVFVMDLYKYIFPKYNFDTWEVDDYEQELNLFYVAVTRAIKHCFLVTSDNRLNSSLQQKVGTDSEFLALDGTQNLYQNYRK